ncbi:MAG: molybdopterin-dependent oxidoreductase [Planctomycetes bacterium]|nr:molybdopterin-dependent oxidoreductase [Planctomycetota bacterium]MBL7044130.1 molybdopterin-dependent oxidoreductase [Pirellulaceae bacterium]
MDKTRRVAEEHIDVTRRFFLQIGAAGAAALNVAPLWAQENESEPALADAIAKLEYLTSADKFKMFGRGNPPPHTLSPEKRREVGLDPETWQLEVVADPDSNAEVGSPLSKEVGTALDWQRLMQLAEKHAVRFLHVVTCTNGRRPCGMGLWEGVPLRDVIWLAKPTVNVRRVFYYGYHNDDPKQRFQSSLPMGRVLEDPPGEHPAILCYKLNDKWLTPKAGAPVRMVVPDRYGNMSVKWLQRIVLTNNFKANDTYAEWNNDVDSHMKTCARFILAPKKAESGQPIPVTGLAQVGMSGLSKVQYWLCSQDADLPTDDPYFAKGDWKEAEILPPPREWGGGLPGGVLPPTPRQVDPATGKPKTWPLRGTIVHWAALLTDVRPGRYHLRCRTIDANGIAQPMPRPYLKSGHNAIEQVPLVVQS